MEIETDRKRVRLIVVCLGVVIDCLVATPTDGTDVRVIDLDPVVDIPVVLILEFHR